MEPSTAKPAPLPRLREDLVLQQGATAADGSQTWLIYDPLQHRFTQIDVATFTILSLWRGSQSPAGLSAKAEAQLGIPLAAREFERLAAFLETHGLVEGSPRQGWKDLAAVAARRRHWSLTSLAHNYLFLKIPLFRPERFLRLTSPIVAPLFSRSAAGVILLTGAAGFYLVSRQWDQFARAAWQLASGEGAAAMAVTLFFVKALHELGHAYTAARYGCRVPSLGLAVVMLAPMPYTDVTDAWRLRDRRQRLHIDAAGIVVEIGLACIATFLWAFLPDGLPRTIAFLVATTSWVMSLAINLNPFMRFDGYYILADLMRIENLQSRSFELGTWRLREILFACGAPCPEVLPVHTVRWLTVYAWATWLTRLVTFTGIALAVYAYFFKLLGIVLFAFEIVYFVARPIQGEMRQWWTMRARIMDTWRFYWTVACAALGLAAIVLPWSTTVYVAAVLEGRDLARVYAPRPARIKSVHANAGQRVEAGALLVTLDVPEIASEEAITRAKLMVVRLRLARRSADAKDLEDALVLEEERAAQTSRLKSLAAERRQLDVRAPLGGQIAELLADLHPGRWLAAREQIALIDGSHNVRLAGYVSAHDLARIQPGAKGRFVPEDAQESTVDVVLTGIAVSGAAEIDIAELASIYGGDVAVEINARQKLVPASAQYRVTLDASETELSPVKTLRGTVRLAGAPESFLSRAWRRVLTVLVREGGA